MATFALIAPPLTGHLNPTLALGKGLISGGHRAIYFGQADTALPVSKAGVAYRTVGLETHPPGDLAKRSRYLAQGQTLSGLRQTIATMARDTAMLVDELPDAFRRAGVDAVVTDQLEPAGALVARYLGMPYVSLANALPINRDPIVPPFFVGWGPDTSAWGRQKIRGAEWVYDLMLGAHAHVISAAAERWALGDLRTCADCLSPWADLIQIPAALDFPREHVAEQMHYVGPIRSTPAAATAGGAMEDHVWRDDGAPRVFASFGTLFGGRFDLFMQFL